ncbi:GTP-binding protein [Treponema sp. Marseille-Q4130]|uniref:CobW family GTP-binding protein n=1 Tax=Treponema sp. Marseille-Q4130 TaxID=2766702 RepID=UPI001651C0D3|nr:GTP-binding protein [Treponema sp. Marseille-Q4130]MBC6719193.1 GTP-binding protein [Treponema sp. Marseille-Q4130]
MNILIVSGFLGAGKTTFIRKLAEKTDKRFAVMENEYGDAGIDGNLLEQNRLKVWELTEGCICCSKKSDFAMSVLTIANTVDPEYLVVEPTGVGLLSSVIANLRKIEYERIRLLKPVTVVDIDCIDSYLTTFEKFYADQIENASHIVVSKIENKTEAEIEKAVRTLKGLNPDADITAQPYDSLDAAWWGDFFDAAKNTFTGKTALFPLPLSAAPDLETASFTGIAIQSIEELISYLSALIAERFGRVYRVKGFVPINGQWAKFDVVDKRYSIETCDAMKESKLTVIGKDLDKNALKLLFAC